MKYSHDYQRLENIAVIYAEDVTTTDTIYRYYKCTPMPVCAKAVQDIPVTAGVNRSLSQQY